MNAESNESANAVIQSNLAALMGIRLPVSLRFGKTEMILGDVLSLGAGSIIELQSGQSEFVELIVNGRQFARGEVVSVDGCYGIRITEINKSRRADDALYENDAV